MKNKKLVALIAIPVLGLGILGASLASAHGMMGGFGWFGGSTATPDQIATRQQTMFQNEANMLGVSVSDVTNAWAQGQTLQQLATAKGITAAQLQQKMKDYRLQQLKTQLQALVDKGVITQAQSDQRLNFMQSKASSMNANNKGRMLNFSRGLFNNPTSSTAK